MTEREALESWRRACEWHEKLTTLPFWARGRKTRTIATIELPSEPQTQHDDHEHRSADSAGDE